jgi:hypothetical protein
VNVTLEEEKGVRDLLAVLEVWFGLRKNEYQGSGRTNMAQSFGTGKLFVLMSVDRSMGHKEARLVISYVPTLRAFAGLNVTAGTYVRQVFRPRCFRPRFFRSTVRTEFDVQKKKAT